MSDRADRLTALLGSRICHDLISPLGAISNGVELLGLSGAQHSPEIALISESVENANARIRFFRVAFGAAAADQKVGEPEIVSILNMVSQGGRVTYDWTAQGEQPRQEVRIAFLLIQCMESAMAYGGAITITKDGDTWQMTGVADRLKIDDALWQSLDQGDQSDLPAAAHVHFAILPGVLQEAGRSVSYELTDRQITARF
ncbi:histidine phosphotransferase family protein [Pseudaestuariivita rosea]|uniref:histidine phosphotransferase family protein n=1 Tax=Pseudaestuariivita rosea TaxID=2763263 RepID=UPI001ABAA916|nr:histidine phosphotransferase family protein [Pseudaestuariivita rosea]